jgi:DNA-binding GntR family transcriptional regulator
VLDKAAICERLGVSRFPVSEALSRLQGEGLVDILPQRGSMVSRVRIADVVEFMLIRRALESEAIRVLIARQPDGIVEELQRSLAAQAKAARDGDHQTFHNCDVQFHEILFEPMQFSHIHAIIDRARANLTRARLLILDPRRLQVTQAEHRAIAEAIIASDTERAVASMRIHLDNVTDEFLAFARSSPGLFIDPERINDNIALFDRGH